MFSVIKLICSYQLTSLDWLNGLRNYYPLVELDRDYIGSFMWLSQCDIVGVLYPWQPGFLWICVKKRVGSGHQHTEERLSDADMW